jgi:two-component system nitrogen regulation sensor histidine kinase GlnL
LAHELRNPLAGLKGAAQLLARRGADRRDRDERELIELIGSEIEPPQRPCSTSCCRRPRPRRMRDEHPCRAGTRAAPGRERGGWAVRLQRDYDPSIPEFPATPDRLTQAVWNLVRNAIQAGAGNIICAPASSMACASASSAHDGLRLEVADDGRGVPEELAEHLFLPLVSGRAEGSGLGLALAQQVAREHRGTLTYRSRPGHTVFTLLLPIGTKPRRALAQPREPSPCRLNRPRPAPHLGGRRRSLGALRAGTALREAGYQVDGFDSAAAALDALGDRHVPDLLFTDVRMPGDDGLVLLDKLKPRCRSCRWW